MADKKIIDLTAISSQTGTDLYEVSLNGSGSRKETRAQQLSYTNLNLFSGQDNVYVAQNGSNSTGTGIQTNPFADPFYASDHVTGSGTDAKEIIIAPGVYLTSSLLLKPLVSFIGTRSSTLYVSPSNFVLHSSWSVAANSSFCSFSNLQITTSGFVLDFSSLTATNLQFDINTCTINTGPIVITGQDSNPVTFNFINSKTSGSTTLKSLNAYLQNCEINDFTIQSKASGTGATIVHCDHTTIAGNVIVGGDTSRNTTAYFKASPINGSITIDKPQVSVYIDAVSWPQGGFIFTNGADASQVLKLSQALSIAPSSIITLTSSGGFIDTDAGLGTKFVHTMTESTTLDEPSNLEEGQWYQWQFIQAASAKTLAFDSIFKWPGGTALTISTGNGDVDIITGFYDGTNINTAISGQNFS